MKHIINIIFALFTSLVMQAKEKQEIIVTEHYLYANLPKDIDNVIFHNGAALKDNSIVIRKNNSEERIRIGFFPSADRLPDNAGLYFCCFTGGGAYVAEIDIAMPFYCNYGLSIYKSVGDLHWLSMNDFLEWLNEVKKRHSSYLRNVTIIFWAPSNFDLYQNWTYFHALFEMDSWSIEPYISAFVCGSDTRPPICPSIDKKIAEEILHEIELFASLHQAAKEREGSVAPDSSSLMRKLEQYKKKHPVELFYAIASSGRLFPEIFLYRDISTNKTRQDSTH